MPEPVKMLSAAECAAMQEIMDRYNIAGAEIGSRYVPVDRLLTTVRHFAELLKGTQHHMDHCSVLRPSSEWFGRYGQKLTVPECTCGLAERRAADAAYFTNPAADADSQPAVAAPKKEGREE